LVIVEQLTTKVQIEQACALLHDVYIAHMQWKVPENNPSHIKIIVKNNRKLLVDRFINDAIWFGAFNNKTMIGCARLCGKDISGKFEIQAYPASKSVQEYLNDACIEAGKVAVLPEYHGQKILEKLYLHLLEYAFKHKLNIFGCSNNAYIRSLFNRINLPLIEEAAFKYHESDSSPVSFYMVNYKKGDYASIISSLKNIIDSRKNTNKLSDILKNIVSIVPVPMYWMDVNGVVLGVNSLCLKGMGVTKIDDVVGKTPYDFYPKRLADAIISHNNKVMQSGEVLSQEEEFRYFHNGKTGYANAVKSPLYNEDGQLIGIIGVSIDITAEKESELLKRENQKQQAKLRLTNRVSDCLDQIQNLVQMHKLNILNDEINDKLYPKQEAIQLDIKLSRREKQILYYLSLNKSTKEIANILGKIDNKILSYKTVLSIINKKLYVKFNVMNISDLVERAHKYKLIPFAINNM